MIGLGEIAIIGGIIILIFGASRIPKLGRAMGRSVREFKEGLHEGDDDEDEDDEGDGDTDKPEQE